VGERPLDLRYTLSTFRRHRRLLAGAALAGAAIGACLVLLRPPLYASTSLILLPSAVTASGEVEPREVETEIRIATSDAVLGPAAASLRPPMEVTTLSRHVTVEAPTPDVLEIVAEADTPARAQALSRAVTDAEVAYVSGSTGSLSNAQRSALTAREAELDQSLAAVRDEIAKAADRRRGGTSADDAADATVLAQLTAQEGTLVLQIDQVKDRLAGIEPGASARVIQQASPAKRPAIIASFVWTTLLGAVLVAALVTAVLAVFIARDRRLRYRDDLADALGRPVIAAVESRAARSAAGWSGLLAGHSADPTEAWAFRQALHQLTEHASPALPGHHEVRGSQTRRPMLVAVVSLSGDPRGLAVGPQLACYAASTGLRTRLVPAQGDETSAPLWAACAGVEDEAEVRPGLRVDSRLRPRTDADLTVVLVVTDPGEPSVPDLPDEALVVLAVSSGSATAEELARVAVTADDAGLRIPGMIVADPDILDRTTGRLLRPERTQQLSLPTHLTGVPGRLPAPAARRRQG